MNDESIHSSIRCRGSFVVVEFKGNRREIFSNPFEFPFTRGDAAIVEADRGQDAGIVRCVLENVMDGADEVEFKVIRRATTQDKERIENLHEYEKKAFSVCREKIKQHDLPMKLIESECRFDGLKLTFFFTAEGRIDFRELVKDLAGAFRTRIELRQIGARDETKRIDGYGSCGLRVCCVSFMSSFQPITTQMAKVQNLILNPSKLSGWCGRLKCCLVFECDLYSNGEIKQSIIDDTEQEDSETIDQMSD